MQPSIGREAYNFGQVGLMNYDPPCTASDMTGKRFADRVN